MTAELLNSKICSIMLLNDTGQELILEATQSTSPDYIKKPHIKVGESVSGKAVQEKRPIIVPDVRRERAYQYPEIAKREGVVSMLSVPMMVQDRVIGVLNSYTTLERVFTEEEVKILQAVANQAAAAIDNAKTQEGARRARKAMEGRRVFDRAKTILMADHHITDDAAYQLLNEKSREAKRPAREIAEAIIMAEEMKISA